MGTAVCDLSHHALPRSARVFPQPSTSLSKFHLQKRFLFLSEVFIRATTKTPEHIVPVYNLPEDAATEAAHSAEATQAAQ
jgi:hypothetical protein